MSPRELDRIEVLGRVAERRLTQREAAERLGLSLRQVAPLSRALRERGRQYADFGPTLALEKLTATHGIGISRTKKRSTSVPPRPQT